MFSVTAWTSFFKSILMKCVMNDSRLRVFIISFEHKSIVITWPLLVLLPNSFSPSSLSTFIFPRLIQHRLSFPPPHLFLPSPPSSPRPPPCVRCVCTFAAIMNNEYLFCHHLIFGRCLNVLHDFFAVLFFPSFFVCVCWIVMNAASF